jgi:hypothetical protein
MVTVVLSLKGGVGKTSLAAYMAFETGTPVITNQYDYPELPHILPEGSCSVLEEGEEFPSIPDDIDVIIDCNNKIDGNLQDLLRDADSIVIPITWGTGNMYRSFATLEEVKSVIGDDEDWQEKITIIGNCLHPKTKSKADRTFKADKKNKGSDDPTYLAIMAELEKHFPGNEFVKFPVANSAAFRRVIEDRASIRDIMRKAIEDNPKLPKAFINRRYSPVIEQMEDIIEHLKLGGE